MKILNIKRLSTKQKKSLPFFQHGIQKQHFPEKSKKKIIIYGNFLPEPLRSLAPWVMYNSYPYPFKRI